MYRGNRVIVVMPAFNAAKTLVPTYREVMEQGIVDRIILVDDASRDDTSAIARELANLRLHVHEVNRGYGGNQKTCYRLALEENADIVIMVHPDYQYTPKLIPAMGALIGSGLYDCVLGSRILGGHALAGGMPRWKYVANRVLTISENLLLGERLSEYHTGYRAFSRAVLESLPLDENSDGFVFDNQMLAQILWFGFRVCEVGCPTSYFPEASTVHFGTGIPYGLGCLRTGLEYRLARWRLLPSRRFPAGTRKPPNPTAKSSIP